MGDEDWVIVKRPLEKDYWQPTSLDAGNVEPLKITMDEPSKFWTDALPLGNGKLGAMVWGGIPSELIQLNEDTLWTGYPASTDFANPNALKSLPLVRKLAFSGHFVEATTEAYKMLGDNEETYQPLGDIHLEFDDSHLKYDKQTYHRQLDLDTATARLKYSVGDVEFTREHFASYPDQVIMTKISASMPGSVSFTLYLDSKVYFQSSLNGKNQIILEGVCRGKRNPMHPKGAVNDQDKPNPEGIRFTAVLDLQISGGRGEVQVLDGKKLRVEGSDWAALRLVVASSFDGPFIKPWESKKDPTSESFSALKSISGLSYDEIYARHLDDYQNLFHRVSIKLSRGSQTVTSKPTPERIKSFPQDEDPAFFELLFQFGRYLLIASSRPGTQVSNLQGIWNDQLQPAWDCAPHTNINLQMNYWPSLPCNLHELQLPLFECLKNISINGTKTAKVNYGVRGWLGHHVTDIWAKSSPFNTQPHDSLWQMGGAWIATHLWEHYTFTLDKDFLKDIAYPLLEGCATFLLDWLIEGPFGYLETCPSTSPEHQFTAPIGKLASVSYSTAMDMQIINEIFNGITAAAQILGRQDDALIQKVKKAQPRLRPTRIAEDGSVMEWALPFEDPMVHHRHISHLFGLFPGHTITPEKTPDLCKAAERTLHKRGMEGPGWSSTWKTACWARLLDSEKAYENIKFLIKLVDPSTEIALVGGGLYTNLFTAHPPFQIDANFGFAAAVSEMIVQSSLNDLYLLPALPRDKWPMGCVKGMKARGGVTVNISWKEGNLHEFGIWSKEENLLQRLHYRGTTVTANIASGKVYTFNRKLKCVNMQPLSEVISALM